MKTPAPIYMWSIVVIQTRSTWLHWYTIRRTRAEAVQTYLDGFVEPYRTQMLNERGKTWRAERVRVECVPSGSNHS